VAIKKILFVDDELEMQELIGDALESEGFHVRLAGSGNSAEQLLAREQFDLVIADLHMPNGDGLSLLASIVAVKVNRPYVFMCTGSSNLSHEHLINLGATLVVDKPFRISTLVDNINALK